MNWGARIAALYIGFVVLIITLVSMAVSQRLDLVTPEYYAEELKFQDKINSRNAAHALKEPLQWTVSKNQIEIKFPDEFANQNIEGEILFFRPSDARMDKKVAVQPVELVQIIPTNQFPEGYFEMQISWNAGGKSFYNEASIRIDNK